MKKVNNDAMKDYIYETQDFALDIVKKSSEICKEFAEKLSQKKYERILLVASGTSLNACLSSRHFMEKVLKIPCTLSTSHDYANYATIFKDTDLVITVTQEGESTNTIDAILKANEKKVDNFVVTEKVDNTCSRLAKGKVTIECGREYFGPKTKGYVCTVLTLYMMALEAAYHSHRITENQYDVYKTHCLETLCNMQTIIEESESFIQENIDDFVKCEKAYVIGYGPQVGTALEGALKSLETVRELYFSFETEEFLHGPLASVKPDVYTFVISPRGKDYERSYKLYKSMSVQNQHVYFIGKSKETDKHIFNGSFIDHEFMSVFEYIIPLQLLAYRTYSAKGIDLNIRNYPRTSTAVPTKAKELERK